MSGFVEVGACDLLSPVHEQSEVKDILLKQKFEVWFRYLLPVEDLLAGKTLVLLCGCRLRSGSPVVGLTLDRSSIIPEFARAASHSHEPAI